jgi:hypothetical protein
VEQRWRKVEHRHQLEGPTLRHCATCATPYRGGQVVVAQAPAFWP